LGEKRRREANHESGDDEHGGILRGTLQSSPDRKKDKTYIHHLLPPVSISNPGGREQSDDLGDWIHCIHKAEESASGIAEGITPLRQSL
jgi:hypothetical protein